MKTVWPASLPADGPATYPHTKAREGTEGRQMTDDDTTKRACLYMLRKGLASYVEISELSGRSRQIVAHWGKDYPDARAEYLKAQWDKAILQATKKKRPT